MKTKITTLFLTGIILASISLSSCSRKTPEPEEPERTADAISDSAGEDIPQDDGEAPEETIDPEELQLRGILSEMTLEEKVCQLFMITPEQLTHVGTVVQAGETTKAALQQYPVGGLIYFQQNIVDEQQLKDMITDTQSYSKYPLFIGVDEEGGSLVARIANSDGFSVEKFPNMRVIGDSQDYSEAYRAGQTIGSYLHELGFNMDFAPVADVLTNPSNTAIGARSFGPDPEVDAQMTANMVKGLQEQGVCAVLKHFPGHGGTDGDSHESAVANDRTLDQLQSTEFLPFASGIHAGAGCVMAGHISLPSVTAEPLPATLSREIMTDLLRGSLGFNGIIITDSMQMGAITNYYTPEDAAVKSIAAGADIILMPENFEQAYQGILNAVQDGTLTVERIDESVYRILHYKLFQN